MQTLQRTPLYDRHVALGARMVPFAGWEMPVQYEGVIPEHRAVRADCGAFDVSHMGELEVEGPRATAFLQSVLSNDLERIAPGGAQYTLLTNERGGIVDDLIAYRLEPHRYLLIVNAGNKDAAFAWLKEREVRGHRGERPLGRVRPDRGAGAARARAAGAGRRARVHVRDEHARRDRVHGEPHRATRASPAASCSRWPRTRLRSGTPCSRAAPSPAGSAPATRCGSRSATRCTGTTSRPETDAISAGLGWVCALEKEFTGAAELRRIKAEGPARKLVAFVMAEKAIPRHGMPIEGGGEVTSGSHSPMLDVGIGMGYVPSPAAEPGKEITIDVRGRPRRATIVRKPIYKREER